MSFDVVPAVLAVTLPVTALPSEKLPCGTGEVSSYRLSIEDQGRYGFTKLPGELPVFVHPALVDLGSHRLHLQNLGLSGSCYGVWRLRRRGQRRRQNQERHESGNCVDIGNHSDLYQARQRVLSHKKSAPPLGGRSVSVAILTAPTPSSTARVVLAGTTGMEP